jgi:hypothetical protein
VVAVRSEREPNRYEPLNETHRRVAEEEEKRRAAINEAPTFSRESIEVDPWTAVYLEIPRNADAALLRDALGVVSQCQGAVADPPGLALHAFEPMDVGKDKTREQNLEAATRRLGELDNRLLGLEAEPTPHRPGPDPEPQRPEAEPDYSPDAIEARLAAEKERLEELVKQGRINESELTDRFSRFDQNLRSEIEQAGRTPPIQPHDRSGSSGDEMSPEPERGEPQFEQRPEDTRDQAADQSREKPSERVPETRIEREAQAAEYVIVGRGEMSDARAARLALLRSIDRDIERENRENEGKGPELDHDSGDRSR